MRSRWLTLWYVLLGLLVAETAAYGVSAYAAGYCRNLAWREFAAATSDWHEVDKVPYAGLINNCARREGVSAGLVASVIQAESSFQPRAVSGTGAMGLMQVMPATWREVNSGIKACAGRHSGECTADCYFDPELNIRVGTAYLSGLARRYGGNWLMALAAYNAGAGAVDRYGGIPPFGETEGYVERVMANWYVFTGQSLPGYSLAAGYWQRGRVTLGWALLVTAGLTIWTMLQLKRSCRSWRWR